MPGVAILALVRLSHNPMSDIAKHCAVVTAHFKRGSWWHICPRHVSSTGQNHCRPVSRTRKMFRCSLRDTSSARSHTRRGTECLLHRVVGQWPTYRTGGPGRLLGPVRVTYSVFRVRRSTQLRRLRPERHAVPRTQENAGPVGDRETSGRRWEDEWGDNGARLHSHPSEKQAVAAATRQTLADSKRRNLKGDRVYFGINLPRHLFQEIFSPFEGHTHLHLHRCDA